VLQHVERRRRNVLDSKVGVESPHTTPGFPSDAYL
jgi:hypothetical protein